jgi:PAS domain S-box-containing protein
VSNDQQTIRLTTWSKETLQGCTANYITHYPIEQAGNWADCIHLKKPIIYNDFPNSPNQKGLPQGHFPVTRILSVPILEGDKVNAIFGVGNKIEPYIEDDVFQLDIIASELNKILKQRQAETALVESKEKYQALFAHMLDGFAYCQILIDNQGKPSDFKILEVNQSFASMLRTKKEEVVGKKASELMVLKNLDPQVISRIAKVALEGINERFEIQIRSISLWLSITLYSPKQGHFAAVFRDITEQKRAEQALKESQEQLQLKLDSLLSPEIEIDEQELANIIDKPSIKATMEYLNSVTKLTFGLIDLKGNIIVATGWQDICLNYHRKNPVTCKNCIESDTELTKGLKKGETRLYKCNNHIWDSATPLFISDKQVANVFFGQFFFDDEVPDRELFKAQAEKYGFNKEQYLAAFDRIPRISRNALETLTQFYTQIAESISKISLANLKLAKALNMQKQLQMALEYKNTQVEEYATQMEELAEDRARQLKDAERLSAIGATAGMVGHDIRNPLQAITNNLYLTRRKANLLPDGDIKQSIGKNIQTIEENLRYINKIVADLQDFAAPLNPRKERLKAEESLRDALSMVDIPKNVSVTVETPDALLVVYADYTMLKRVLINLIQNAVQAMPQGGELMVSVTKQGNNIEYTIQDTGVGIPLEVQAKIFTPLVTTKPKGQGFGLAVVKRMTEAMGGEIMFDTQLGKGTRFTVSFPV